MVGTYLLYNNNKWVVKSLFHANTGITSRECFRLLAAIFCHIQRTAGSSSNLSGKLTLLSMTLSEWLLSSCTHWHDQLWMLQIVCDSILSFAKNNRVKLKPLRLADTSYYTCVLSDSGIESTTALVSCGFNVVSRSIPNNENKQNNTTFCSNSLNEKPQ